jgi:hypothetical protein
MDILKISSYLYGFARLFEGGNSFEGFVIEGIDSEQSF